MIEHDAELLEELDLDDWEDVEGEEESAFLASLARQGESDEEVGKSLNELERLADTAGINVLGIYHQRRNRPERGTFFGKGFLTEIQQKMLGVKADLLIVNEELSPMQVRNIERDYHIHVVDRTEIILGIFHQHARTKEAKLQIKLAELEYQLPRLRRLWGHFDRERGSMRSTGGTATRGMGEKQIEIDKRLIRIQIARIKHAITKVMHQKETQRKQREKTRRICLVGYTNAGKSTLFNVLTDAGVLVEDKLFATLDSTSRQLKLSTGNPAVISDTVGFISNLPHHLVASFQATLMEVQDANLLLHMVDASDDRYDYYIEQVNVVLEEISAEHIKQVLIFNKTDLFSRDYQALLTKRFPDAIFISALNHAGIDLLISRIEQDVFDSRTIDLLIPYDKSRFVSQLHGIAQIISEEYLAEGTRIKAVINAEDLYHIKDYIISE
ncbi:MAG: GTPase HflX [Candidatus Cloacimonetes bacterium]|nr:GTPase HflX [Candidatus Cloacimonadota bacterium]